jgi:hypothetical protein
MILSVTQLFPEQLASVPSAIIANFPDGRFGGPPAITCGAITKQTANGLRSNMAAAIDDAKLSEQAKAALKLKLTTLNTVDQRTRLKAVMGALGLQLGDDEDAAWWRRNKAGMARHPQGEELAAIRDMRVAARAGDRDRTMKSLPLRHTASKSKHCRDGVPPKSRKPAISE